MRPQLLLGYALHFLVVHECFLAYCIVLTKTQKMKRRT